MNRRGFVAALATGIVASAGCLTGSSDPGTTPSGSTTATPTETATSTETPTATEGPTDATVGLSDVEVAPQFVALNSPDSIGTFGERDEQFVLASVAVDGPPAPARDEFALEAGDETYAAAEDVGGPGSMLWDRDSRYGSDDSSNGWLAFRVPKPLDADAAAITWPGGEHSLDETSVAELARPPTDWEIREFSAPDSVAIGEEATVSLTVANVGEADGTFVGALNRVGPWVAYSPEEAVSLVVPAGETTSWEFDHAISGRQSDGDDLTMTFHLDWRDGRESREITVEAT